MRDNDTAQLGDVIIRLFWMMVGPLLLAVLGFTIINIDSGWLTGADFAYLGVVAALMLARWLEFRRGHPRTAEGKPATQDHLRRYLIGVGIIGLGVWVIANVLGNYVVPG